MAAAVSAGSGQMTSDERDAAVASATPQVGYLRIITHLALLLQGFAFA